MTARKPDRLWNAASEGNIRVMRRFSPFVTAVQNLPGFPAAAERGVERRTKCIGTRRIKPEASGLARLAKKRQPVPSGKKIRQTADYSPFGLSQVHF